MDTTIVHYSQTRRKACEGCVRSKRRCDLIIPRCGRCVNRDVECEYVTEFDSEEAEAVRPVWSSLRLADISKTGKGLNARSSLLSNASLLNLVPRDAESTFSIPAFHIPSRVTPSALHLNYLSTFFRTAIPSLALHSRAFFIHPSATSATMPPTLQAAISVSALSTLHAPSTYIILSSNLSALIADSHKTFHSPLSILYSVQALIIYQIIRLFSSETQQIYHAEVDFSLLNNWTIKLQTAYFEITPSQLYSHWILKESIRRTILTSVLIRSLYVTMKDGYTELVPLLASLPVSLNGWLWEMENEEGLKEIVKEEVGTYWEFLVAWSKRDEERREGEKGAFEKVLLCLEEDGEAGEAAWELINGVRLGGY